MPPYRRKPKRTVAEARRRRFLIVIALLALVVIALSPLLFAGFSGAPSSGPQLLP